MRIGPDDAYVLEGDGKYPAMYLRSLKIADLRALAVEHFLMVAAEHRPSVKVVNPCWGLGADQVGWNLEGSAGIPKCADCGRRVAASAVMVEDAGTDLETVRCYRCQVIRHFGRCAYINQIRLPLEGL